MPVINFKSPKRLPPNVSEACQIHLRCIVKAINDVHPRRRFYHIDDSPFQNEKQVLVAIGKNALEMALSCNEKSNTGFLKVFVLQAKGYYTEESLKLMPPDWNFVETSHPLPDHETFKGSKEVLDYLQSIDKETVVHFCVSGGGSSSFSVPEIGLSSEDYVSIIKRGMLSGFDIYQLNYIRALLDQTKGGKTGALIPGNEIHTWVVSDILDDNPAYVGSGPTTTGMKRDPQMEDWLQRALKELGVEIRFEYLLELFSVAQEPIAKHHTHLVTTRKDFALALQNRLSKSGFSNEIISINLEGSVAKCANEIMRTIAKTASEAKSELKHTLIWMGEPTIELSEEAYTGKGGRISALALRMAEHLKNHPNILFLGLATDGKDGNSPDAGYVVSAETWEHLRPLGGPFSILKRGNSGKALSSLGYGISLDHTQVNLLDLYLVIFI